jgi:hypothetical protein
MKDIEEKLKKLNFLRKNGEISSKEFYKGLLELIDGIAKRKEIGELSENQLKKQISLLHLFVKNWIKLLRDG